MNKKLEKIKPYVKFFLEHATGQPISDDDITLICNKNGKMNSIANVVEGYVLFSQTRLMKREDLYKDKEENE